LVGPSPHRTYIASSTSRGSKLGGTISEYLDVGSDETTAGEVGKEVGTERFGNTLICLRYSKRSWVFCYIESSNSFCLSA
jgi:hypothetical protein